MENTLSVLIKAKLDKIASQKQITQDIKLLEKALKALKLVARLNRPESRKLIEEDTAKLSQQVDYLKLKAKIDKKLARTQLSQDVGDLEKTTRTMTLKAKIKQGAVKADVQSEIKQGQAIAAKAPIDIGIRISEAQHQNLIAKIQNFGAKNSNLFKSSDSTITYNQLLDDAYSANTSKQMQEITTRLSTFREQLNSTGQSGLSFGDKMKKGLGTAFSLFGWTGAAMATYNVLRDQTQEVLELDKAITKLYKVQNDISSRNEFPQYLDNCLKRAQDLAVKTQSLIESSVEWSKIGFGLSDADKLSVVSVKLENTGDMDITNATQSLISAAQAFKEVDGFGDDQYVEKVERIGDKINAIGNKYSISTEGIADALQNSSAALSVAGNTLDEAIALYAAGNKIFQSPGEFGNAMKVGAMRLRGQKGELEEMGEDVAGVIEGVSKVQTQIANLTKGKVNIFEADNETLKSTYEIYTEIGKVYKSTSDKDQASLIEILFGKQRGSAGSALLLNIDEAAKVYQDSLNAAGSMDEEFAKHQESAEAAVIRLQESIVGLSTNVLRGELIKNLADAGTSTITFADNMHLLETAIKAVIGYGIAKFALGIGKTFTEVAGSVKNFSSAMNLLNNTKKSGFDDTSLKALGIATKNLTDEQLKLFMSSKLLTDQQKKDIIISQGLTGEKQKAKLATLGLDSATKASTTSTVAATTATFSFKGAVLGLGAVIKSAFLSNPVGWIIMGLSLAIPLVTKAFDALNVTVDEHREELNNLKSEYQDITSSLQSVQSELDTTKTRIEELLAKDTLTLYEQEELDRLVATNDELERQIQLLEIEKKLKSGDVNRKFNETFRKDVENGGEHGGYVALAPDDPATAIEYVPKDEKQFMDEQIQSYNTRKAEIARLENELLTVTDDKIRERLNSQLATEETGLSEIESYLANRQAQFRKDTEGVSYIPEPANADEQAVNDALDFINDFYDKVAIAVEGDSYKATAFRRIYSKEQFAEVKEELSDLARQGQLTEDTLSNPKYDGFVDNLDFVGISAKEATDQINSFVSASNNTPSDLSVSVSVDQLEAARKATDSLVTSTKTLSSAFEEQRETGRLSAETILGIVDAGYAAALQVDQETGIVTINQQAYIALAQAKIQEQIASLQTDRAALVAELETEKAAALNLAGAYLEEAKAKMIAKQDSVDSIDAQIRALDTVKSNLGSVVTGYYHVGNAAKQAADEMKKAFQSAQSSINTLLDMTMKMVKQRYEDEKDRLQNQMDDLQDRYEAEKDDLEEVNKEKEAQYKRDREAIEDQKKDLKAKLDAELEILRAKKEEYYWDKETKENNKTISELKAEYEIAKKDNSLEGLAHQKELQDQLAQAEEEWGDKQFDHDIESQEEALNKEFNLADEKYQNELDDLERVEEQRKTDHQAELDRIQNRYESKRERLEQEMQDISDYVAIESNIRGEAIALIEGKSQEFYNMLMQWNLQYGDGLTSTLQIAWANGYAALETYNNGQLNVLATLNDLALKMDLCQYNGQKKLKGYATFFNSISSFCCGVM